MSVTDPIADMLARIRNAHQALHDSLEMPTSTTKASIAGILKEEGYITDYSIEDAKLIIKLKYSSGKALVLGTKRISKPGRRVYVGVSDIPDVQNGLGICILSTSKGILDGYAARSENVGGELLCEIW